MSYAQHLTEDLRMRILQALVGAPYYTLNEIVLRCVLSDYGHSISRDHLRGELTWLDEMGLCTLQKVGGDALGVFLLTLTSRGEDCAAGLSRVPGVARPRAGA